MDIREIIRVFPSKKNFTPNDEMAFFDVPGLFVPEHTRVDVCTIFSWDRQRAEYLADAWKERTNKPVNLGGPAFGSESGEFTPGLYIKKGVTFASRGCPNNCPYCFVPSREGKLREIQIKEGHIIQDNNFLACSPEHKTKVYEMLKKQRAIDFRGGLEPCRLSDWDVEQMRGLRISELWLACDTKNALPSLRKAAEKLSKAGFSKNQIRCYVLIGDDMAENEARLLDVYNAGCLPFAQLFQPEERKEYSKEWKDFVRIWSRPAIYNAILKKKEG